MCATFVRHGTPHALDLAEVLRREERNYLQALLKVKRYANCAALNKDAAHGVAREVRITRGPVGGARLLTPQQTTEQ